MRNRKRIRRRGHFACLIMFMFIYLSVAMSIGLGMDIRQNGWAQFSPFRVMLIVCNPITWLLGTMLYNAISEALKPITLTERLGEQIGRRHESSRIGGLIDVIEGQAERIGLGVNQWEWRTAFGIPICLWKRGAVLAVTALATVWTGQLWFTDMQAYWSAPALVRLSLVVIALVYCVLITLVAAQFAPAPVQQRPVYNPREY